MNQKELLEKVKAAKSVEEIIEISKETGKEIAAEEAKQLFNELQKAGELSDEELNTVAGGGGVRTEDGVLIVSPFYGCGESTTFFKTCCGCRHCGWHQGAMVCWLNVK